MTPRKILAIRNDRMGDLLMSLPAVHRIRQTFQKASLSLLLHKDLEPLLQEHPDIDQLLTWNPKEGKGWSGIFQWARRLKKERFDAVVIFNPTRLFHVATFFAGIPIRIGYRRKWGGLLTGSLPDTKASRGLREVDYNLELIGLLGIAPSSEEPVLVLPRRENTEQEVDELLKRHGLWASNCLVAFHPWTSNPTKGWPLDSFQGVIRNLRTHGQPVLVIGGHEEQPVMERWRSSLPQGTVDLVGKVPLRALPALLSRCTVLVSNDSGPVHVAAAVGTPTIVVAPKTHAELLSRWRPLGKGHRILLSPSTDEVTEALCVS